MNNGDQPAFPEELIRGAIRKYRDTRDEWYQQHPMNRELPAYDFDDMIDEIHTAWDAMLKEAENAE